MERGELFRAIEEICPFVDTRPLLDRIGEALRLDGESGEEGEKENRGESKTGERQGAKEESDTKKKTGWDEPGTKKRLRNKEASETKTKGTEVWKEPGTRNEEKLETGRGPEAREEPKVQENGAEISDKENPFYIERGNEVIHAAGYKETVMYHWKIKAVEDLKEFVEKYRGREDVSSDVKLVGNLINEIGKNPPPDYEEDNDNSEKLAKYVYANILKKWVTKISTSCYRVIFGGDEWKEFYVELIDTMNTYLQNLGVYTILPHPGIPYDDVINCYRLFCDTSQGSIANPIITKVECPAYVIEYIDEDGDLRSFCMQGTCVSERGKGYEFS